MRLPLAGPMHASGLEVEFELIGMPTPVSADMLEAFEPPTDICPYSNQLRLLGLLHPSVSNRNSVGSAYHPSPRWAVPVPDAALAEIAKVPVATTHKVGDSPEFWERLLRLP
jgi:hypothetical protein